jgi:hypothetical protein
MCSATIPFTSIVEPSVPYSLAVMIQNSGKGTARNVQIASAQPRIVENEKGLLIDFKILGTEVPAVRPPLRSPPNLERLLPARSASAVGC